MLKTVRGTMQGPFNPKWDSLKDARGLERLPYLLLIVILLAVGFLPSLILPTITVGTKPLTDRMEKISSALNIVRKEGRGHEF